MKKTLALALTVVMLLALVPVAAFAANNGPANVDWAYIYVYPLTDGDGVSVYESKKTNNSIIPGISYEKASNTLTLNNYRSAECAVSANMMGDDFKIKVTGNCEIGCIQVYGDGWGGSLTITGNGTLSVNKAGLSNTAIVLRAENVKAKLTVDKDVTVKLFGEDGVFYSDYNLLNDASKVVTAVNGQKVFDIKCKPLRYEESLHPVAYEILDSESSCYRDYAAEKSDDPDSEYGVRVSTDITGAKIFNVSKYVYSEKYDVCFRDPGFNEKYGDEYGEVEFTKDEFEALGFSMTVTEKKLSSLYFKEGSTINSGPKLTNSADPNGIYMIKHKGYEYTDQQDPSTYIFKGTIYKLIEGEDGLQRDKSFAPIEIGATSLEALPAGYTVVLDEKYESLYLKGIYEEIDGNLYTDTAGNQYVVSSEFSGNTNHEYVYSLSEIPEIPGCYVATYVEDIEGVENPGYTEVTVTRDSGTFEFTTEVKEFTFNAQSSTAPSKATPSKAAPSFPDVKKTDWFYAPVQYCAEKGYIKGYSNGNFGPADALTRQDFVIILARIAGVNLNNYADKPSGLSDVAAGQYYTNAINWAVKEKVLSGYSNGKFGVGDPITREQVAVILHNYMGKPRTGSSDALAAFADRGQISDFAKNAMTWAVNNKIITGMNSTTLAPVATASRAEIAAMIARMDQKGMFA